MSDSLVAPPTYKMAAARLFFHGVASIGGAILASLNAVKWATLDDQARFLIVVGIVCSVSSTAAAFCDKTMARLSDSKSILNK